MRRPGLGDVAQASPSATLTVRRTVRPGREGEYETEFAEVLTQAAAMPGWLGANILTIGTSPAEYDTRLHFVSADAPRDEDGPSSLLAQIVRSSRSRAEPWSWTPWSSGAWARAHRCV